MGNRLGEGLQEAGYSYFSDRRHPWPKRTGIGGCLALKVVTPLDFHQCIWIIGFFAIGWTLMGGMRTVIWTDVMQFFLFVGAGLFHFFGLF